MQESSDYWFSNQMRLRYAEDFQAIENFKITEVKLEGMGFTTEMLEALVKWTPQQMSCMLEGKPPTAPPPGLDLMKIQQASQSLPVIMSLTDTKIFPPLVAEGSPALESQLVQDELSKLTADHENLIRLGVNFRQFDPRGKEAFLDQLEMIQERWRVFITRFQLMGDLNPEFIQTSQQYLMQVGMTIEQYNTLMANVHQRMRDEVQREALQR
ncbi:unnamed protein product [Durusdinium trenchii]|uniref:Uncharacterized protein n=1 Tax=Durusdinium trenchii TaxID=1381693 RepID=A0ABP0IEG2_9DINO